MFFSDIEWCVWRRDVRKLKQLVMNPKRYKEMRHQREICTVSTWNPLGYSLYGQWVLASTTMSQVDEDIFEVLLGIPEFLDEVNYYPACYPGRTAFALAVMNCRYDKCYKLLYAFGLGQNSRITYGISNNDAVFQRHSLNVNIPLVQNTKEWWLDVAFKIYSKEIYLWDMVSSSEQNFALECVRVYPSRDIFSSMTGQDDINIMRIKNLLVHYDNDIRQARLWFLRVIKVKFRHNFFENVFTLQAKQWFPAVYSGERLSIQY